MQAEADEAEGQRKQQEEKDREQDEQENVDINAIGNNSGPKYYITVQLCPPDHKPYSLDCIIDSGSQMNLMNMTSKGRFGNEAAFVTNGPAEYRHFYI